MLEALWAVAIGTPIAVTVLALWRDRTGEYVLVLAFLAAIVAIGTGIAAASIDCPDGGCHGDYTLYAVFTVALGVICLVHLVIACALFVVAARRQRRPSGFEDDRQTDPSSDHRPPPSRRSGSEAGHQDASAPDTDAHLTS